MPCPGRTRFGTKTPCFMNSMSSAFYDGNDDGDWGFRGLIQKLDYLEWLGVDCLWLLALLSLSAERRWL